MAVMGSLVDSVDRVLASDIEFIDSVLSVKDSVREEVIRVSREIIRFSGEAIRLIHLGKYSEALDRVRAAGLKASELVRKLSDQPDLLYSGLVYNCLCEYVEALVIYSLVVEKKMPSYRELNIPYIPYLQGLGDVVGELRRYVIDLLRNERYSEARTYLDVMETIYQWLRKLNYPDALTPGLRHKVDVARRLIEDTKILYLNTINSYELRRRLEETREFLERIGRG